MRVTKTVKEHIENQVKIRLKPKYKAESDECDRRYKEHEDFLEGCANAALAAWNAYFDAHFQEIAYFCKDSRNEHTPSCYNSDSATIINRYDKEEVYGWSRRFNNEVTEKVNNIIVELELGGNKADLIRLLNEI